MANNIYGFEKKRSFKAITAVEILVVTVLALAVVAMLSFFFIFSKEGTAHKFFGQYIYLSKVSIMEPAIPVGSAVFGDPAAVDSLTAGEVVLCNVEVNGGTVTTILRIQDIQPENGSTYYILRGDANAGNETIRLEKKDILAKCVQFSQAFGAVLTFATSQLGILTGIILPCLIAIVIQVLRIVRIKKYDNDDDDEYEVDDVIFSTLRHAPAPEPVIESPVQRLAIGDEGRAEYVKKAQPTAGYGELHETIRSTRPQSPLRQSSAAERLESQRSTVSENFRTKPTTYSPTRENTYSRPERTLDAVLYERPKTYYEKAAVAPQPPLDPPVVQNPVDISIPEQAVKPRETIAPPPKPANNKTVEELMRVIDQAQSGLRK